MRVMLLYYYKKLLIAEQIDFDEADFKSPDRPYTFNCIEEAIFKERNGLKAVNNYESPYSVLLVGLARKVQRIGEFTRAREYYERALIWNPVESRIDFLRFLLYMRDYQAFEENAKEAFKYAYRDFDDLYEVMKDYMKAIGMPKAGRLSRDNLENRLKENGFEIHSVDEIADFLLKQGKNVEAEGKLKHAIEFYKAVNRLRPDSSVENIIHDLQGKIIREDLDPTSNLGGD